MSRGTVWGKIYLLFWKKSCFSFASVHQDFFCGFRQDIFRSVTKNAFYVSSEKICEKTGFSRERICFFIIFGLCAIFPPLFQHFVGIVKTAFHLSKCISRKFFLERFSVTLGQGAKRFGLLSKNFPQGFQTSFYVSAGNFWGIIYFSGKNRFFSIIFEYWVVLFWRTRHNCMLRVQIPFKVK